MVQKDILPKNSKGQSEERKKRKQLVRKKETQAEKNVNTTYMKSSYAFTIQKFLYSSFLCFT